MSIKIKEEQEEWDYEEKEEETVVAIEKARVMKKEERKHQKEWDAVGKVGTIKTKRRRTLYISKNIRGKTKWVEGTDERNAEDGEEKNGGK